MVPVVLPRVSVLIASGLADVLLAVLALGVALLTGYPLPCLPNSLCVEQDEKVWLPWSYREVLKQAAALQITDPAFPVNSREGRPMTEPETQYQRYLARKRQKQEKKTQVSAFWTVVLWLDSAETRWS